MTIATFMMTPVYRSSVMIKIDKENPNVLDIKDVYRIEPGADDYYQTQYKILKSRNLAKRVIRALKLSENPEFADEKTVKAPAVENTDANPRLNEGLPEQVVDTYLKHLTVEPQQKSRLVKVSFDSYNPQLAADAANAVARSFIDFNIESKFEATNEARNWLEQQLQEMKAKMERSEESLNDYAAKNGIIFVNERQDEKKGVTNGSENIVASRLSQLSTALVQATSDRIGKEAAYRSMQSANPEESAVIMSSLLMQKLKETLANFEAEYSQLSKVYKPDYPKMVRLREQIKQIRSSMAGEVSSAVGASKNDYEAALSKEKTLTVALDQYKQEALNLNERMVQYQILKREVETNKELYNALLQRMKETGLSASMTASNIMILDRAEVQKKPHKPMKAVNILISLLVGLFGGVGLAFFTEYLDNTVKTPDDIERGVALPSLGMVPHFGKLESRTNSSLIAFDDKKSPLSEAYRSIGTYIQFSAAGKPPKTILVTSSRQGEGKSTTVVNAAIAMAHSVGKGIIIDADLRKPQLHKFFDADNTRGLSDYLTGNAALHTDLVQKTKVENLDIITSGIIPPNPSELLASQRMREMLQELAAEYDFIFIDSPPILGMSDSVVLSTMTDGVIIVIRARQTTKDHAAQSRKLLQGVNAKILGVVLNGVTSSDLRYGSYDYYYSYYYEGGYGDSSGSSSKKSKGAKAA